MASEKLTIALDGERTVSALLDDAKKPRAVLVLAHGAGAGMTHPFMSAVARGLAELGVATLRYQFPYMEAKSGRPDRPEVAHATVRAAVAEARGRFPKLAIFAGGKSFGGRMTSQAEAIEPLGIKGLVFFGFPLHASGKPSDERAAHLAGVKVPMLFLQGSRDSLASLDLLKPLVKHLGKRATLAIFENADHSFHVPKASGLTDKEVMAELIERAAKWIGAPG
jgi:uncharacterized protein